MMQMLIKLLTPSSPAYGNSLAFEKPVTCTQLTKSLRPGDVILSRTNSLLYQLARKFMGINYDHVSVVLNEREVIHISPPMITKIDMEYIMNQKREPWIIRPRVEDREKLVNILQGFIGDKYSLNAIPKYAFNELLRKLNITKNQQYSLSNLKYSKICSDAVLYALCRSSQKMAAAAQQLSQKGTFKQLGFFTPDQVAQVLLDCDSQVIIKSKFTQTYGIEGAIERYSQSKKDVIGFLQAIVSKLTGLKSQIQVITILKFILSALAISKSPLSFLTGRLTKRLNLDSYESVAIILMLATMIHQYFQLRQVANRSPQPKL